MWRRKKMKPQQQQQRPLHLLLLLIFSMASSQHCCAFVGNIPYDATEETSLSDIFKVMRSTAGNYELILLKMIKSLTEIENRAVKDLGLATNVDCKKQVRGPSIQIEYVHQQSSDLQKTIWPLIWI